MSKFEYKQPPKHHKSEIEITPENLQVFTESLLGLDKQGVEKLKERITSNRGHVRMMMHPFFSRYMRFEDQEKFESSYAHSFKAMLNAVQNQNSSPIFIFESIGRLSEVSSYIEEKVKDLKSSVFIIPTHRSRPYASVATHIPDFNLASYFLSDKSELYVIQMFKSLGIKSITVSGLWISECLSRLTDEYKEYFLVDTSKNCLYYDTGMEESYNERPKDEFAKQTGKIK